MTHQDGQGGPRVEPRFDVPGQSPERPGTTDEGFDEGGRNLRGKVLGAVVAVAAIAGFAGIAWYATKQGRDDPAAVVPTIRADKAPIKVLPEKPGGMKVPNQDKLIFMEIDPNAKKDKVERLLPPPETPVTKPAPPKAAPAPAQEAAKIEKDPKATAGAVPMPPPEIEAPPSKAATAKAPERAPKPEAVPEVPQTTARATPEKTPAPVTAATGYRVQLGAVRSKARAVSEATRLTQRHKTVLGKLMVTANRADLGKRGIYYRLQAGPLADRSAAEALCRKLKARKTGCIVVKP
ncbi:MAG: SPOR domain-containing protein [Alphaproteobacteria bacterium]|nr:SPOR domain-containing protein [Alphaproteobacteria bacterium]